MTMVTRRAALIGFSAFVASPIRAETSKPNAGEFAELERPAVFDIAASTGSLKETVQKGQELLWHGKEGQKERQFQISNISVAFLRSEAGGQLKMTFSCNVSSFGYLTPEPAKLNVIVRSKGGAALHSWSFGIAVKCGDNNQPITPLTHEVPSDVAANVFTNVGTVELAEYREPGFPGVKVQRCG